MSRRMSPTRRVRIFDTHGGVCHLCGGRIQVGEAWDVDHVIALALSDDDSDENLRPAHAKCHRGAGSKTSADVAQIAKAKRVRSKHIGAGKRSSFPGSRTHHLKRKIDGRVVPRNEGETP